MRNLLEKLKGEFPFIEEVRGKGLLIGLEMVEGAGSPFTSLIVKKGIQNGILLYPAAAGIDGRSGSAIMIAPPLNSSKRDLEEICLRLKAALRDAAAEWKE